MIDLSKCQAVGFNGQQQSFLFSFMSLEGRTEFLNKSFG